MPNNYSYKLELENNIGDSFDSQTWKGVTFNKITNATYSHTLPLKLQNWGQIQEIEIKDAPDTIDLTVDIDGGIVTEKIKFNKHTPIYCKPSGNQNGNYFEVKIEHDITSRPANPPQAQTPVTVTDKQ